MSKTPDTITVDGVEYARVVPEAPKKPVITMGTKVFCTACGKTLTFGQTYSRPIMVDSLKCTPYLCSSCHDANGNARPERS